MCVNLHVMIVLHLLVSLPSISFCTTSSGGSSPQYLGGHGPMASAIARACNAGLWAEPPAWSRGRAPGQEVRGQSPLKLKHFWFLDV